VRQIAGYVIISSDGMIADAAGVMPPSIVNEADQKFFQAGLDAAAAVVHGQHSHEGGPHAARRKRLVLTRHITATAPHPVYPHALLWNPRGATLEQALDELGAGDGTIAIIGGTDVFTMFLPRYDMFHLSRAASARIPGGRPVFSEVAPETTPEEVLGRYGLRPGPRQTLDAAAGVSVTTWQR